MHSFIVFIKLLAATFCCCFSVLVAGQLRLATVHPNPPKFNFNHLAYDERMGPHLKFVEDLGYVRPVNTFFNPRGVEEMPTRFAIYNNNKHTQGIKFQPKTYSTLGGKLDEVKKGPFEFNLDLMAQSEFNAKTRTIIMIPGYLSHEEEDWIREARDLWLQLDPEADVIQVSWTDCNRDVYDRTVAHTPLIARQITIFLHYLTALGNTSFTDPDFLNNIHLIGHSLGAHIAGFIGQDLGGQVGRITGLDPAGPSFDQYTKESRLDPSDAKFVDILHTNSGKMKYLKMALSAPLHAIGSLPVINNISKAIGSKYNGEADTAWYGIDQNIGHIDYYANNGCVQAGCSGLLHICDHNRARDIYVEALRYEMDLRNQMRYQFGNIKSLENQMILKRSRLMAYKATEYDTFTSGKSFSTYCEDIMRFASSVRMPNEYEYSKSFNACSVPFDLVTPAGEFSEELKSFRGLGIMPDTPGSGKFYFRTLDGGRLIGDHYMIKIHLDHKQSKWDDDACSLMAEIELLTDEGISEINVDSNKLSQIIKDQVPIGMPFIHADGPASRVQLTKLLKAIQNKQLSSSSSQTGGGDASTNTDEVRHLLPERISLSLIRPKTPSFLRSIGQATLKFIKLDSNAAPCSLMINHIEIQPLGVPYGGDKTFIGIYSNHSESNEGSVKGLNIMNVQQYKEKSSKSIGKLSTKSRVNMQLSLQALVIGDELSKTADT